jgi:polyisoprenoid-binding protein YceI
MDTSRRIAIRSFYLFIVAIFVSCAAVGQSRYTIQKAEISFASNAELELIKASSTDVQGLIDPKTNQFAFSIDVRSFKGFNSELQREHFNEKYMESERFPKARFSGKIIEQIDLTKDDSYEVRAKGDLEIHGEKQTRIIKGRITTKDGVLRLDARFTVPLADHNITIPSIVRQKIATEIEVVFTASMLKQQ